MELRELGGVLVEMEGLLVPYRRGSGSSSGEERGD